MQPLAFRTIEHAAATSTFEVDTAREDTYRATLPAPKDGFARNLWLREDDLVRRPAGQPLPRPAHPRGRRRGNRHATPYCSRRRPPRLEWTRRLRGCTCTEVTWLPTRERWAAASPIRQLR